MRVIVLLASCVILGPGCTTPEERVRTEGAEKVEPNGPDAGGTDGSGLPSSCMLAVAGVEVNTMQLADEDGYAPYAIDGCRLAYVSSSTSPYQGALVLRDLTDGHEEILSVELPRRPSVAGDVITWEDTVDGANVVMVRAGSETTALSGDFFTAGEPRAARDAVVFTGWLSGDLNGDTDVFVYSVASKTIELVAGGIGQQRFADISAAYVAVSDFSEDPTGIYDPQGIANANIIVIDRATSMATTRDLYGKQAYPMLGADGRVLYLEWVDIRPMPKLAGYTIRSVALDNLAAEAIVIGQVGTDPPAIRPTARDRLVEWVEYSATIATFWRAPADSANSKVALPDLGDAALFAPQATTDFTVLATQTSNDVPRLEALPR